VSHIWTSSMTLPPGLVAFPHMTLTTRCVNLCMASRFGVVSYFNGQFSKSAACSLVSVASATMCASVVFCLVTREQDSAC
jgi:hypothetical protein